MPGSHCPAVGFGKSWQRLLKEAARDLRTLKRWASRWRSRALQTVPWLASMVTEANPQSELPRYLVKEAPSGYRRMVAEELRWLDALEGLRAKQTTDDDVRGWAWMNVRFAGHPEWF